MEVKRNKNLKFKVKKNSISSKLIATFTVIIVLISLILSFIAIYISDKGMITMVNEDYQKILNSSSDLVIEKILNKITLLDNLSLSKEVTDPKLTVEQKVKELEKYTNSNGFIRIGICDVNGNLVFPDSKVNIKDRDYFKMALEGTSTANDPTKSVNEVDNGIMIIPYASPIVENKKVVGVIVGIASSDEFSNIIENIQIGKTGRVAMYDSKGTTIASHDKNEEIGVANLSDKTGKFSSEYEEIIQKMLNGKSGFGRFKEDGKKNIIVYKLIEDADWIMSIKIEESEILAVSKVMKKTMVISLVVCLAIAIILIYRQTSKMTKALNTSVEHLKNIAKGDMTVNLEKKLLARKDEFGDMSRAMNEMQSSISDMINSTKESTLELEEQAVGLSHLASEMASSSDTVANSIQDVAKGTGEQSGDINNIVDILFEFNDQVEEVMNSTNEIGDESNNIHLLSKESNEEMESVSTSVKNVTVSFSELVEKVNNVEGNVNKINEITVIINGIAEQTNLLALNAAIEAARVGEAGKGFAVVADEIRKLAEQSKVSAADINTLLTTVFNETTAMVGMTEVVQEEIKSQEEIINKAITSFDKINNAVEGMKPKIEKNISIGQAILHGKDEIMDRIQSASSVSEEVSASAEEIAAISEEMNASTDEVSEHSKILANMTKGIKEELDRFNV